MSDHLDKHLHGCLQYHWAAVRNVLENKLGKDTSHVVTPRGEVHDDVLERVEGGPERVGRGWKRVEEGGEREKRGKNRKEEIEDIEENEEESLHWMCR